MTVEKEWGTTERILNTPFVEAHKIIVSPQGKCSWHKHDRKYNAFIVITGSLYLYVKKDCFEITQGAFLAIPYGVPHQFQAGKDGVVAIELYYPAELSEDIVRYSIEELEKIQ